MSSQPDPVCTPYSAARLEASRQGCPKSGQPSRKADPKVTMALRARTTRGSARIDEPGSSGNHVSGLTEERPRRSLSLAVKVAIVIAVIAINLLIYANLEYFKSDIPFKDDQ
ncbi:uncharacterized protein [Dermacentor albipictus]|uniref:uncharacterized protein n=1 Tax=Dermacentor albipictus TaxID=60249 RepID=UPI0031FBD249